MLQHLGQPLQKGNPDERLVRKLVRSVNSLGELLMATNDNKREMFGLGIVSDWVTQKVSRDSSAIYDLSTATLLLDSSNNKK